MRITFCIDMSAARIGDVSLDAFSRQNKKLLWLLEALVKCNRIWLDANPHAPLLYESGVRYEAEPRGEEDWCDIPHVLSQGWGDCEDLAAWRIAELRQRGIAAKGKLKWFKAPSRSQATLYHVQVVLPGNKLEDPSRKLGMRKAA